ncbi:MAG: hypothetical protein LQ338_000331 [Usnochroma carphineum]|nr:MAG: hypothetical protein LQ338_000331 [Usnochroma carphineum]
MTKEMLDYYADELERTIIEVPVLFIAATRDEALPPAMSKAMDGYIPNLTRKSVDAQHWTLWQKPNEVNQIVREWLESVTPNLACLAALASAVGTPPGYLPSTNTTLGLKYGNVTLTCRLQVVKHQPTLSLPSANSSQEYLAIFIDPTANLSSPIPASLLWFQPNVTFTSPLSPASFGANATVPYLAPSVPGHVYIALLYKQPPHFFIPPDFPYNNTFRKGFNVSRVAVDFKTGGPVAANFFELDPYGDQSANATATPSGGLKATATSTAVGREDVTSTVSLFQFATATTQPFRGGAPEAREYGRLWWVLLVGMSAYLLA